MKLSKSLKAISELKAHASEIVSDIFESGSTLFITQNGEAKAVLQDIRAYEELQDSLAFLKILAQSQKSVKTKGTIPFRDAFKSVRARSKKVAT